MFFVGGKGFQASSVSIDSADCSFTEELNKITAVESMIWIIEMILGSVEIWSLVSWTVGSPLGPCFHLVVSSTKVGKVELVLPMHPNCCEHHELYRQIGS